MDALRLDLKLALRTLRQRPGFAFAVIATVAVAVGAVTAVLGVVYGVLLKPLPIQEQGRVVVLRKVGASGVEALVPFAVADLEAYARETRSLATVAGVQYDGAWRANIRDGGRVLAVSMTAVSGDFFRVLGMQPTLGRLLNATDDIAGGEPVAVISPAMWHREFAGDPRIIGRVLRGAAPSDAGLPASHGFRIVGVAAGGFAFPSGTEMWMPTLTINPNAMTDRGVAPYSLVGRLRPGESLASASSDLGLFISRHPPGPGEPAGRADVRTIESLIVGDVRSALFVLAGAVTLLLLIATINVANLLLVRGVERSRELAVRAALGAPRGRLVRQLTTEGFALGILGSLLGGVIAWYLLRIVVSLAPADLPRRDVIDLNPIVLFAATALAICGAGAFSLLPALLHARGGMSDRLSQRGTGSGASHIANVGGSVIVSAQVALALTVLIGAGLLTNTVLRLQFLRLGYSSDELTTAELDLSPSLTAATDVATYLAFYDRVITRVQALPGVSAATVVMAPPFAGSRGWDAFYTVEGQDAAEAAKNPSPDFQAVLPGFFATLGLRIVEGRGFTAADRAGAQAVVVVSQGLARWAWPGRDPIAKRIRFVADSADRWRTVVGVSTDVRYRDLTTTRPVVFTPWAQAPDEVPALSLVVARGRSGKAPSLGGVRQIADQEARGTLVVKVTPFAQLVSAVLSRPRFNALLVGTFAGIAVLLAALGLYAIMASFVRQRTREIGLRMALGAQRSNVRRLVLRRGLGLACVGILCGAGVSLAATQLLRSMLFGVSPVDPLTILASSTVLLVITALACYGPLRRAIDVDPLIALRSE